MFRAATATIAILGVASGGLAGGLLQERARPVSDPPGAIFGFDVGEERRYTLEPLELLKPGELVEYLIRLDSVEGTGEDLKAKFVIENESLRFRYRSNFINPDERLRIMLRLEVTVSRHGFPLEITYRLERDESDHPYLAVDRSLSFDGDRYVLDDRRRMAMNRRLRLPGTDMVDRSVPSGIFLSPYINPGLLSIVFTTLHKAGADEFEYMELNMPWPNFRYRRYRVQGMVTVDIGGIPHDAVLLRDGPQGDTWIAPDGTVLKEEVRDRDRRAWLRLLHPWEY